jgi:hypothetical protein
MADWEAQMRQQQSYDAQQQQQQQQQAQHLAGNDAGSLAASFAAAAASSTAAASAAPAAGGDPSWFEPASLEAAAHAAIDSGDDAVVAQFLLLLEAHRARCERQQLYVEAALVAGKVAQLRAHEDARRAHNLAVRHLAERLDLEEAHILEFDEFGAAWTEKLTGPHGFDTETKSRLLALRARQATELEAWTAQEQEQLLLRPKFSKQLLQLRATQESLAKARDYVGAERVRAQAAQLERVELDALKAAWGAKAHSKRARFLEAQQREEAGFMARRTEERAQLEARKRSELKSLVVQKYANLKSELERAHAKERARMERRVEVGVSDSSTIREEAPRRTNGTAAAQAGEAAAWNAGVDAGNAMRMARAGGTAEEIAATRAAAAAQSIVGGASGTGHLRFQNQGSRRRIEEEQEAMLRERMTGGGAAEGMDAAGQPLSSAAAEVPTIAGALTARSAGGYGAAAPAPYMGVPPVSARSHAAAPAAAPSSSQLLQQQRVALQSKAAPMPSRPQNSSSYDPLGSARRAAAPPQQRALPQRRMMQQPQQQGGGIGQQQPPLSARQPAAALNRAAPRNTTALPYTSRHALATTAGGGRSTTPHAAFPRAEQKESTWF